MLIQRTYNFEEEHIEYLEAEKERTGITISVLMRRLLEHGIEWHKKQKKAGRL